LVFHVSPVRCKFLFAEAKRNLTNSATIGLQKFFETMGGINRRVAARNNIQSLACAIQNDPGR
jgi:hypothetical protein